MSRSAEILGVYSVEASEPCHLIEMRVSGWEPESFVEGITQADPNHTQDNWQAPWDEGVLAVEGGTATLAFFFHCLDLSVPLTTPAGNIRLPAPKEMPKRLSAIRYDSPC